MRKFDLFIFTGLMILSAANSFGAVLSTSDSQQKEYFERCLENPKSHCQNSSNDLIQNLIHEVEADIDREAEAAGVSLETYLSTDAPFTILLNAMQSDQLKKMDRADVTISVVKLGIRYRTIQHTRFVAPHFFENEQIFLRLVRELSVQHRLPFQL